MKHRGLAAVAILGGLITCLVGSVQGSGPAISFIGTGLISGELLDKSGLAGDSICQADNAANCIDQATFGGFGSALAYTGFDSVFVAVPDRGPFDGRTDVPYRDRFHLLHLSVDIAASFPNIQPVLLDTRFLKAEGHQDLVGLSSAFADRFDPEGVAISATGTFFVSDEYGPGDQ